MNRNVYDPKTERYRYDIISPLAKVYIIDYWLPNAFNRQNNWYIVRFNEEITKEGSPYIIVEYKENSNGEYNWQITPRSHNKHRLDLLTMAGKIIDEHYASFYEKIPNNEG